MKNRIFFAASLLIFIPLTIFFQAGFLQNRYTAGKAVDGCEWCEEQNREDVVFIPVSTPIMRLAAPADPDFIADLLWMRTSYYFGEHALTNKQFPYLLHLLDMITDLAPTWDFPYYFGALLLPLEADAVEDGMYMIDKGLAYHPDNWELRFYKGFYLFHLLGRNTEAAEVLYEASQKPGAPFFLARLAATVATRDGQKELALRFLKAALENVKDEKQKESLIQKMKEVMKHDGQNNGNTVE